MIHDFGQTSIEEFCTTTFLCKTTQMLIKYALAHIVGPNYY